MRWAGLFLTLLWAQQSIRDSAVHFFALSVGYGGYAPGADLARRFGWSHLLVGEATYKFKNHLYVSAQGGGLFGDQVKEPGFLQSILLPSLQAGGLLAFIDENGRIFTPNLRQRGWNATLRVGKIFPRLRFPGQNPNCGPFLEIGVGYLSHRILIDKARSERLPLLEGEYLKGLDRLTEGWGLTEAVGYRFFSNRGLINFFVAVEAAQYFTQGRRGYLYDLGVRDAGRRRDVWQGFRVGWVVPLYEKAPLE